MIEQLLSEMQETFNWVLNQLGWSGELNWIKILVLVLAILGALMILRNTLGGGRSVGGRSTSVTYPQGRQFSLPTKYYTGNSKLSDFSVPEEVYDFKVPSPKPDLSNLRKPASFNMDLAGQLFVPSVGRGAAPSTNSSDSEESSRHNRGNSESGSPTEGSSEESSNLSNDNSVSRNLGTPPTFNPNWGLAKRLFIPNVRRKS